ncbi:hypothetical protein [Streptomyces aureus]|jgi:hypothetical protein|uniref:Uncharacterized protein n=1 Tax=Streptomyces aureus TaxID=193461 RepID=A0ABV4SRL3_9ACTN
MSRIVLVAALPAAAPLALPAHPAAAATAYYVGPSGSDAVGTCGSAYDPTGPCPS